MKAFIALGFFFFFSSCLYASSCVVKNQMDDFIFVKCDDYNGERVLYLKDSTPVNVDSEFQDMLVIKKTADLTLVRGDELYIKKNNENQNISSKQISLSSMDIEAVSVPASPVVATEDDTLFRVRTQLLTYQMQSDDNSEVDQFQTSSSDIAFEVIAKGIGIIFAPSFDENISGEAIFFKKLSNFNIGFFISAINQQVKSKKDDQLDRTSVFNGGLFLRLIGNYGKYLSHFNTFKLGYVWGEAVSGDGDDSNNTKIDGVTLEVETDLYFRLAKNVQLGVGLGLSFISTETKAASSTQASEETLSEDLLVASIYPLRLQMEF